MKNLKSDTIQIVSIKRGKKYSIYDAVFPLVKLNENNEPISIFGTAFSISMAPILLTASHNFKKPDLKDPSKDVVIDYHSTGIIRFFDGTWDIYKTNQVNFLDPNDIAIIHVTTVSGNQKPPLFFPLNLSVAKKGDSAFGIGYPKGFNWIKGKIVWVNMAIDNGVITKLHPQGRDKSKNWPLLETSITINAGHSGGPTFSSIDNSVVGINSSSFNTIENLSWSTDIMQCADLGICPKLDVKTPEKTHHLEGMSLNELAEEGFVNILDVSKNQK